MGGQRIAEAEQGRTSTKRMQQCKTMARVTASPRSSHARHESQGSLAASAHSAARVSIRHRPPASHQQAPAPGRPRRLTPRTSGCFLNTEPSMPADTCPLLPICVTQPAMPTADRRAARRDTSVQTFLTMRRSCTVLCAMLSFSRRMRSVVVSSGDASTPAGSGGSRGTGEHTTNQV